MKQKYVVVKVTDTKDVWLREYTELEKGEFAFICEERYSIEDLARAAKTGVPGVVESLRRPNMYPKIEYAEKIAQAVVSLISPENENSSAEVVFDDVEVFRSNASVMSERLK